VGLGECSSRFANGEGDELHPSQYFLRATKRGEYSSFFFMSKPKSMQKPISTRMRVQYLLLGEVDSGVGESGTPLHI
jgi:hypothetical protein